MQKADDVRRGAVNDFISERDISRADEYPSYNILVHIFMGLESMNALLFSLNF